MAMRGWPLIKLLPQKTNLPFRQIRPLRRRPVGGAVRRLDRRLLLPGLNMGIDFRGGASLEVSKPAGQDD
jgi:preprotein translocase subunit SecF